MATSPGEKSVDGLTAVSFRDEKLRQTSVERTGAPVQGRRAPLDARNKEWGTAATVAATAAGGKLARCRGLQF